MPTTHQLRVLIAQAGVTHQVVANWLGCSRPAVTRAINHPKRYPNKILDIQRVLMDRLENSAA